MNLLLVHSHPRRRAHAGFTLLEVMIAAGILFSCLFAILGVLSMALQNARSLKRLPVDAGMLASQLSLTNRLFEGEMSDDFSAYGEIYADYDWTRQIEEVDTNGLFRVDFVVRRRSRGGEVESKMSILLFRPASPPGKMSGGMGGGFPSPAVSPQGGGGGQ